MSVNNIFILIFTLFSAFIYAQNGGFKIVEVQDDVVQKRILLGGTVVPLSKVSFSAQLAGDVIKFDGKAGDSYKKGDLIVSLEQETIQAQKEAANAEIKEMRETLKNARVQYNRSLISPYADADTMFGGMPSMFGAFTNPMRNFTGRGNPEFERYAIRSKSYSELAKANERLKKAQSKLKEIEAKLKDTKIIAPFNGILVKKIVDLGDSVQRGDQLFTFANTSRLQVEVDVPSRLLFSLKKGKTYRIRLDIFNFISNAVLVQIHPIANKDTHTVKVKFDLPLNSPTISGSYAELELFDLVQSKKTPIIPESALVWRSSIPSVFVVDQNNKTELRFVRAGEKVDTKNISILSGLRAGEKVVANPGVLMTSGMTL